MNNIYKTVVSLLALSALFVGCSKTVVIKYDADNQSVIQGIKRISKPGLRIYCTVDKIPQVINGLGIAILSTNKGIMTDKKARAQKVGGEVLCYVW